MSASAARSRQSTARSTRAAGQCHRSLGLSQADPLKIMRRVDAGLVYVALERLRDIVQLPLDELAIIVDIPPRTLHRRKAEGRFSPAESERLVRFAAVFDSALALFDNDVDAARQWLQRQQPALADARPFDLIRSEIGAREVEALIGRLEHGVYS
jgi:putative toxin-antitoxin system antitoxin component (TIGR02293 family)